MKKSIALLLCIFALESCATDQLMRSGDNTTAQTAIEGRESSSSSALPPASEQPVSFSGWAKEDAEKPGKSGSPNGGFSPSYSPDGSMLAFLSSTLHTPADLWVMNADGSGARRLTTKGVQGFKWSPDGKTIILSANRKGFEEILIIDLTGGPERRFPGLPPASGIPVHSPDGKLFAFISPDKENVKDLWIGTADGERIEPVTEKINVRDMFWSPDSRMIYYEAGKTYGVGIWEMDLSTMQSKPLISKYIGTPVYSARANLIAFAYPTNPGEFEVRVIKPDGSGMKSYKTPRLPGRWLSWDGEGKGIYYLGQDVSENGSRGPSEVDKEAQGPSPKEEKAPSSPHETRPEASKRVGVTALWRLDLETGEERLISPKEVHLIDFSLSPVSSRMVLSGVLQNSHNPELFSFNPASGEMLQLVTSRPSAFMPLPSRDSSKIAFFANNAGVDILKVASYSGQELSAYPGIPLETDTRVNWLPESEGLVIFSSRGLFAFTEKGPIEFSNRGDHRAYLYADVSIQADKVLLVAIPRYGETPGLYMLEVADGKFVQTDLRYPAAPEIASELYLQPKWSFDGKYISFTDSVDIWTMKADGTARAWITNYALSNSEGKGKTSIASHPFWSVDSKMIGYTLMQYEGESITRQIWVMASDGSNPRELYSEEVKSKFQVFMPEYTRQPFFDAEGREIIFTAVQDGVPDLFSVNLLDGEKRRLTDGGAIFPALLPEEGVLVYTSLEGNNERLWLMNLDGTGKHPFILTPDIKVSDKPGADAPDGKQAQEKTGPPENTERINDKTSK